MISGRRRGAASALPLLAVLLLLLAAGDSRAQDAAPASSPGTGRALADLLIAQGFENVGVRVPEDSVAGGAVVVAYENRVFRYEMTALGVVAALAAPRVRFAQRLEIVTRTRGVPVLSAAAAPEDWLAFLDGSASEEEFRSRLTIRTGGDMGGAPESGGDGVAGALPPRENPSTWKLDLALRPLLELELGLADDPFRFGAWIAPEATLSPFSGTLLTAQVRVQVEDEIDTGRSGVAPGRTTLTLAHRLPLSCLGTASIGYFPGERYGGGFEVGRLLGRGDFEMRLSADLSGTLIFFPENVFYSDMETWSAAATAIHRARPFDLETTLSGGRFQDGDWGGRLDLSRRFGETGVGFFAIKTEAGSVGGFRLEVPLPVARLSRPARVRLATVPSFPWEYRESLAPIGRRLRLFDNLDRLRKNLSPPYVGTHLAGLRAARRYVPLEETR